MATFYDHRCALCGRFQVTDDREALLANPRLGWDEETVDDYLAGARHDCTDRDPFGARQWQRLADEGEMPIELAWWLELALERQQAASRPAWTAFTGPTSSSAAAPGRAGVTVRGLLAGAVCTMRAHEPLEATWASRSPS